MPDPTSSQRRTAVAMAGHRGDPATARGALGDEAVVVRVAALRALARLEALTDAELTTALGDPAPEVRIAALELAAARPGPGIDHLLTDPDATVVESAAWAVGERPGAPSATIATLSDIARDHPDPLAREAAVAALGSLGDERGLTAVLGATTDKPAVRRRAVIALVAFEGPEVEAAWARARTDRDRQVRDAVEELLGPLPEE